MMLVAVNPELLQWACEPCGIAQEDLASRFRNLPEWESGETQPSLNQAEAFARAVHVPVGYLFLTKPPEELVSISDFRPFAGQAVTRPSRNLFNTIYTCQERQSWYRDFVRVGSAPDRALVSGATVEKAPETVEAEMPETLGFDVAAHPACPTWADATRLFIQQPRWPGSSSW